MWIKVKSRRVIVEEDLIALEIDQNKRDLFWVETAIRSEDIRDFYPITAKKIVVFFYEEAKPIVIAESFESFYDRIKDLDYDQEEEEDRPKEKSMK